MMYVAVIMRRLFSSRAFQFSSLPSVRSRVKAATVGPWSGQREVTRRAPPAAGLAGDPGRTSPEAADGEHSVTASESTCAFPGERGQFTNSTRSLFLLPKEFPFFICYGAEFISSSGFLRGEAAGPVVFNGPRW